MSTHWGSNIHPLRGKYPPIEGQIFIHWGPTIHPPGANYTNRGQIFTH